MKSLDPQLKSVLPGMQAHGAETGSRQVSPMLAWALIVAAWAALLFVFRPYVEMVLVAWETLPSHAHGYIVLLVVAYLLWTKRQHLAASVCRPSWKGFTALVLLSVRALASYFQQSRIETVGERVVTAAQRTVERLRERGFEFVRLDRLLERSADHEALSSERCSPLAGGSPPVEDSMGEPTDRRAA